jgi:hypothetical protein
MPKLNAEDQEMLPGDIAERRIDSQEIDFFLFCRVLWQGKWMLLPFAIVCIGLAIAFLHLTQYRYRAELAVSPVDQQSSARPTGGLSGLGSLVGIDIGGQTNSSFLLYTEAAKSYPVAEMLSRDKRIMSTLFADSWDSKTNQWREPHSGLRSIKKSLVSLIGVPVQHWRAPNGVDLKKQIDARVSISDDKKRLTRVITFVHADPDFCVYFLARLNATTDQFLRQRSLNRSTQYIAYLQKRMDNIHIAELRQSLAEALSSYEKTHMMASSDAAFAAESFGNIWVSSKPVTPAPVVVLISALSVAFLLWITYVFIFRYIPIVVPQAMEQRAKGEAE